MGDAKVSSREAAVIIDCSPDDLYDLVKRGVIKGKKDGRRWRFSKSSVIAYARREERREAQYAPKSDAL